MHSLSIFDLQDPLGSQEAANKRYVDTTVSNKVLHSGYMMTSVLNVGRNKITTLGAPTSPQDAVNQQYVEWRQHVGNIGNS